MDITKGCRGSFVLLAALSTFAGSAAADEGPAPGPNPLYTQATEKVRQVIEQFAGSKTWDAEPPRDEIAKRGQPVEATWVNGSGHALVAFDSNGNPAGAHLWLQHAKIEGDRATTTECVLRLGQDGNWVCPPSRVSIVDCKTWSVPVESARAALLAARAALFVRVFEKKYLDDPYEELVDSGMVFGRIGGVDGGSDVDFVVSADIVEAGDPPIRVSEHWAGYASPGRSGRFARSSAAASFLNDAFKQPDNTPSSPPPVELHKEFSRLFSNLPLDDEFWWWVRERMVLMAGALGTEADLPLLKAYLQPKTTTVPDVRLRDYALEALARRTGQDPRCQEGRRVLGSDAAARWLNP